jgi:hypothetical protein
VNHGPLAPRGPSAPADSGSSEPGSAVPGTPWHCAPAEPRHPCGTGRVPLCLLDPLCRGSSGPTGRGTRTPAAPAGRRAPCRRPPRSPMPAVPTRAAPAHSRRPLLPLALTLASRRHPPGPSMPGRPTPPASYLRHLRARHPRGAGQHPGELGALRLGTPPAGRGRQDRHRGLR